MRIFYMNQGGASANSWGAVDYASYDILLLAESTTTQDGFNPLISSGTRPPMTILLNASRDIRTSEVKNLDLTAASVRPLYTFEISCCNVRIIYMHLKSASEPRATAELETAIRNSEHFTTRHPIIWVGDFNRADTSRTMLDAQFRGGGVACWDLDRVYTTGVWPNGTPTTVEVTKSTDNGHAGVGIALQGCEKHQQPYEKQAGKVIRERKPPERYKPY